MNHPGARESLLQSFLTKGGELIDNVKDQSGKVIQRAQGAFQETLERTHLKEYVTLGETLGGIAVDVARAQVSAALQYAAPKIFKPEQTANDTGVEAIKGEKIVVWLVHPTNYREDGTPRKWKRQILPSNAIGQLWALMPKEIQMGDDKKLPVELHFLEDTAQPFDIEAIKKTMEGEGVKGMVMFCGVQSNQWPRALNLASLCQKEGIPTVAGGYHVRADLPLSAKQAEKYGMSLAIGEAESEVSGDPGRRIFLQAILEDLANGELRPEYRQDRNPKIDGTLMSEVLPEYQRLMITPEMATLESSRGCPLPCTFCTIRVNGGTEVRARTPEEMKPWLRKIYDEQGIRKMFITDDNFGRSEEKFAILKMFQDMKNEGRPFGLMVQVDTRIATSKTKIRLDEHGNIIKQGGKEVEEGKAFVEACRDAGVYAVFLGVESVDKETLRGMGKGHNRPQDYKEMIDKWHGANILAQCGFIIGNKTDTKGVGKRSAQAIKDMGIDIAAAYVLTPLPASVDYYNFHKQGGVIKETDFNTYDSHSRAYLEFEGGLSRTEVEQEYREFYEEFFSLKNLLALSKNLHGETLRAAIRQWIWYLYASKRGDHPMYSGLGKLEPDYVRSEFPDDTPATVEEMAPREDGPGSPAFEERNRSSRATNLVGRLTATTPNEAVAAMGPAAHDGERVRLRVV